MTRELATEDVQSAQTLGVPGRGTPRLLRPHRATRRTPVRHNPPVSAGALEEWWRQLRDGSRTVLLMDVLWCAACCEAEAGDWARLGVNSIAVRLRFDAAYIIAASASGSWRTA